MKEVLEFLFGEHGVNDFEDSGFIFFPPLERVFNSCFSQYIQFGDGRIVYNPAEYGYEYHYYHKDHLGNIRQVFRARSTFIKIREIF